MRMCPSIAFITSLCVASGPRVSLVSRSAPPSCRHAIGEVVLVGIAGEVVTGCPLWHFPVVWWSDRAQVIAGQRLGSAPPREPPPCARKLPVFLPLLPGAPLELRLQLWAPVHCARRPVPSCGRKPTRVCCGEDDGLAAPRASPPGGRW